MANLSNINNKFLVTTGGNVGIGNTSPTLSTLTVGIGSTNNPSQICQLAGSGSGVYSVLSLTNTNGTAADNNGVGLDFHVNSAYSATGRIQLIHPTAQSGQASNSSMQFLTYGTVSGVTTFSPRMTIDYRGNVGIGTDSPDYDLDVERTALTINDDPTIRVRNAWSGEGNNIGFSNRADGLYTAGSTAVTTRIRSRYDTGANYGEVGTTTNHDFRFITNGGEKMRVTSAGNVGIGTTSPIFDLQTNLTITGSPLVYLNNTTSVLGTQNFGAVHNSSALGTNSSSGLLLANNDKSVGAISPPIFFSAKSSSNTYNASYAAIYGVRTGNGADTNWCAGDIVFATSASSGANERMRITSGGNVGIGTTSPSAQLQVVQTTATWTGGFKNYAAGGYGLRIDMSGGSGVNAALQAYTATGTGVIIKNNGLVGIGTFTPRGILEISKNDGPELFLTRNDGNVASEDLIGSLTFYNEDADGTHRSSWIRGYATETFGRKGYLSFATAGVNSTDATEKMRIQATGDVVFGKQTSATNTAGTVITPTGQTNISRTIGSGTTYFFRFYNAGTNSQIGAIAGSATNISYGTSSDYRLKEDLQDFEGLDIVSKIPVYDFKWKVDESRSYGVMAHELQEVLPDAVSGEKDAEEMQGVDYSKIVPLLVKSIQELEAKIKVLENK